MNLLSNASNGISAGCTPCECGVPGACLQEQLPSFLQFIPTFFIHYFLAFALPLLAVLVPTLIARVVLRNILINANNSIIRTVSVLIGSLFVLPSIYGYFQPNTISETTLLIAPIFAIAVVYFGLVVADLKKRTATISGVLVGTLLITGIISIVTFSYKYITEAEYNQVIDKRKNTVSSLLQSLGVTQNADEVVGLLKSRDYTALEEYINPNKKLEIYFRDYDGANFSRQEFHTIQSSNRLSEVNVYKNVADFSVTAQQLLDYINSQLNGKYETDYYIDNHNYVDDNEDDSDYSEAVFLYKSNSATTTLTFTKDVDSVWYLSRIGYYDPKLQGY